MAAGLIRAAKFCRVGGNPLYLSNVSSKLCAVVCWCRSVRWRCVRRTLQGLEMCVPMCGCWGRSLATRTACGSACATMLRCCLLYTSPSPRDAHES
eukprot:1634082-Prymnesium_polylepis.3